MTTQADLAPLFTDVPMSSCEATAIAAALHDIAQSDGTHEDEIAMISELLSALDADLGEVEPTKLEEMTPQRLAVKLGEDPTLKKIALQCGVLLAMADGKISEQERERLTAYALALGLSEEYEQIESAIVGWVTSGDAAPMFG